MLHRKFSYIVLVTATLYGEQPLSIEGLVNFDTSFDSRQVVASREGHELRWPERKDCDPLGRDINDKGQLTMIPLYTRMTATIDGQQLSEDVATHALFEADFRGTTTENASMLRLRKAYIDFDWGHSALRVGKAWHPTYVIGCTPNMVTYDNAEPPDPQVRTPQIRFTHRFTNDMDRVAHELLFVAASHDIGSRLLGPAGPAFDTDGLQLRRSSDFIRRAVVPNLHVQYRHYWDDHFLAFAGDYQRIIPRLETALGFREQEDLESGNFIACLALNFPRWSVRNKVIFSENATAYDLPHGFGIASRDPKTDIQTYTNMRAFGYWIDMDVMTDRYIQPGILAAVHTSLGTGAPLHRDADDHVTLIAQEPDLDFVLKVAPRVWWSQEPLEVGAEIGISHATFADPETPDPGQRKFDDFGEALRTSSVTNVRFVTSMYYYF